MKNIFLSLSFLLATHSALACSNPEAQFIGTVINHREYTSYEVLVECFYNIKISSYQESGICGLEQNAVEAETFSDPTCSLKEGQQVSGYLSVKDGQIIF